MKKIIIVAIVFAWFLCSLVWFALRALGVTEVSWWWATIGLWAPTFIVLAMVNLAASLYYIINILRVLGGGAPDLTVINNNHLNS